MRFRGMRPALSVIDLVDHGEEPDDDEAETRARLRADLFEAAKEGERDEVEELIEAERRRDDGALRFEENPNDLADRIARLANEPPRTGREEDAEGGANDARGSYDERFDERFGDALDTAAPSVSFAARVERIPPPTVDRRGGDARARVDGRDDTAGEAGATGEAGPSGLSGLARPLRSFTYGDGDATDVSLSFDREVSGEASRLEEPRGAPSPGGAEPGSPNGAPVASTTGDAARKRA